MSFLATPDGIVLHVPESNPGLIASVVPLEHFRCNFLSRQPNVAKTSRLKCLDYLYLQQQSVQSMQAFGYL
jgi:hypothetical protein